MIAFVMFVAAMINGLIKGKSNTGNNISLILALIEIPEIKLDTNISVKFINNVDKISGKKFTSISKDKKCKIRKYDQSLH